MKVLIVGLPYFSQLLAHELNQKYSEHTFISLNTYYNRKDRLLYLYHILNADIVHSINGTVEKSLVIDIAIKLNKKLIMHWVGSDFVNSKELYDKNQHIQKYLDYATHVTVAPWYVDDLKQIGVNAKYLALKAFDKEYPSIEFLKEFRVLIYIAQHDPDFYGMKSLIEIAKHTPDVPYDVVGLGDYKSQIPENIILHSWTNDIEKWIKQAVVCLRMPKTDGLSFFVLESLALQRYVAHNKDFVYSDFCVSNEDFINYITEKKNLFDSHKLELNTEIAKEISIAFNKNSVLKRTMIIYQDVLSN